MEPRCACKGSVAMGWEEGHRDGVCIGRFCSGGLGGETWRWIVHVKVL